MTNLLQFLEWQEWRLSETQHWLSHVTARKLAASLPSREISWVRIFCLLPSPECAVMMQSPKIHGRPAEDSAPLKTSYVTTKKSHDPWVHLLAGA
jgi:hypothetical protein